MNVSECTFNFEYIRNDHPKRWHQVNQENLEIQMFENVVYFLVKDDFLTGYTYDFKLAITSKNGEINRFGYNNHSFRGKFWLLMWLSELNFGQILEKKSQKF